mmetsp:Transcript_36579/g.116417  ORF Transcript_36579/g.116417 Transcript_36579/m.116417 type:complete len:258 (+) Transcript_36579:3703-4476(+)
MRALIPVSSSFRKPCALLSFASTSLAVAPSLPCAEAVALPMRSSTSAEGCSSANGSAAAETLSTSLSAACKRVKTSESICFARMRSSASLVAFCSFETSCCMLFTLDCNLPSSEPDPEPEIASFFNSVVFWRRYFRATRMLACAACSARFACSTASVRPSATESPAAPMLPRGSAASVIRCTSPSAAATLASTSSRTCERFRSAVLDLNCCKRSRPSSKRFWSMSISSFTVCAGPPVKRATSTSFLATKVCASANAL